MENEGIKEFLNGKSDISISLYSHFLAEFKKLGPVSLYPTKSMIGIVYKEKKIAWITQIGKNFVHVVFPFKKAYSNNLCFIKIAQVPGTNQYNHHLRIFNVDDINTEVKNFMKLAI